MVTRVVYVGAQGESFMTAIEVDGEDLDSERMPDRLTGRFTELPSKTEQAAQRASFLLHENRSDDGSSHTIWFHGNRTGYRFTMTSDAAFSAEKLYFQSD